MKPPLNHEIRKPTKTLAGVTPIAVMCKPKPCAHGTCLYCPSLNVPQSYTPKSPPVLRAELLKYNPNKQIAARLEAYRAMHHPTDKIELIIMGGNFLEYPRRYKHDFIKSCYDALNNKISRNLKAARKLNENAGHRCVALCIESRPDTIAGNKHSIKEMLDFGCTRVEIGVQTLSNAIYKKIGRHHTLKDVVEATKLLRNAGFKVGYHIMLGLPGSNKKKDIAMFKKLFSDENFKPDQLKIYPCQVIKGAKLEQIYKKKKYQPYTKEQIQNLVIKILQIIPNYCRVMRVMREIPPEFLVAGTTRIDLRRDIEDEIKKRGLKITEIRFREIGFALRDLPPGKRRKINQQLKLKITKYKASSGNEYFLEIINRQNILFGLCRLRIQKQNKNMLAVVRELHVYGQSLAVGKKSKSSVQHKGLGKKLLVEAEKITAQNKIYSLHIISGVGARQYFRKLGYKLDADGEYMCKELQ